MAKATVNKKMVKKMVEVEVESASKEVVLTLTMQEACALRILLGAVSGPPQGTIREFLTPVWSALEGHVESPPGTRGDNEYVYASVSHATVVDTASKIRSLFQANDGAEAILKLYPKDS